MLPMYDWPEISDSTDRFWSLLSASLRSRGIDAPSELIRQDDYAPLWQMPNLVLGQSCGLPYVLDLKEKVFLVGTPDYEIKAGAGEYFSVIVANRNRKERSLRDFSGATFAYNSRCSQSGYAALFYCFNSAGAGLGKGMETGSHRASMQAVAKGKADIAAIDAVTWELGLRHEAAAPELKVIAQTAPTPGLPFICGANFRNQLPAITKCVKETITALDRSTKDALLLRGFVTSKPEDYDIVLRRWENLEEAGRR